MNGLTPPTWNRPEERNRRQQGGIEHCRLHGTVYTHLMAARQGVLWKENGALNFNFRNLYFNLYSGKIGAGDGDRTRTASLEG